MRLPLKILNSKEIKEFLMELKESFDCKTDFLKKEYFFFISETRKRYYILKKSDYVNSLPDSLRINRIGCYFAKKEDGLLRLSIEGSQIIGPSAKKNVVEIKPENKESWLMGEPIEIDEDLAEQIKEKVQLDKNRFVIIKCGSDFLGCGKVTREKILNFVPKERRVHASFEG